MLGLPMTTPSSTAMRRKASIIAAMSMLMGHWLEQVWQPTQIHMVLQVSASWLRPNCSSRITWLGV